MEDAGPLVQEFERDRQPGDVLLLHLATLFIYGYYQRATRLDRMPLSVGYVPRLADPQVWLVDDPDVAKRAAEALARTSRVWFVGSRLRAAREKGIREPRGHRDAGARAPATRRAADAAQPAAGGASTALRPGNVKLNVEPMFLARPSPCLARTARALQDPACDVSSSSSRPASWSSDRRPGSLAIGSAPRRAAARDLRPTGKPPGRSRVGGRRAAGRHLVRDSTLLPGTRCGRLQHLATRNVLADVRVEHRIIASMGMDTFGYWALAGRVAAARPLAVVLINLRAMKPEMDRYADLVGEIDLADLPGRSRCRTRAGSRRRDSSWHAWTTKSADAFNVAAKNRGSRLQVPPSVASAVLDLIAEYDRPIGPRHPMVRSGSCGRADRAIEPLSWWS